VDVRRNSDDKQRLIQRGLQNFIDKFTSFGKSSSRIPGTSWNDDFLVYLFRRFVDSTLTKENVGELLKQKGIETLFQKLQARQRNFAGLDEDVQYFFQYLFVWTPMCTDYRFQILDRLKALFGDPSDKLRIFAPAIVDLD
jgi:hypothetical protein